MFLFAFFQTLGWIFSLGWKIILLPGTLLLKGIWHLVKAIANLGAAAVGFTVLILLVGVVAALVLFNFASVITVVSIVIEAGELCLEMLGDLFSLLFFWW